MDAQQEAKTIYILHFRVGAHCRAKRRGKMMQQVCSMAMAFSALRLDCALTILQQSVRAAIATITGAALPSNS